MSTEAPGSQQLLLGFTLYLSGAVVRTCEDIKGTFNNAFFLSPQFIEYINAIVIL